MLKGILSISILLLLGSMSSGAGGESPPPGAPEPTLTQQIASWNELLFEMALAEDKLLTLKGLRTACLMHLAMHDALNAIDRRFSVYATDQDEPGVDAVGAVAQAAFLVLSEQYPDQRERLQAKLAEALDRLAPGQPRTRARQLGQRCAVAVFERRSNDGWDTEAEYSWHPMGPGVYAEFNEHSGTPEGFVFGAGWAQATPFVLSAPEQFRVPPPPAIDSEEYVEAYREVQEVGRFQSMTRTPDQTHLALWWKDFVENSHNRLARQLVVAEGLDAWRAARLFAQLNMSIYDAYISSFDNKFFYNHWRPYTAIRWAAHDGNPHTEPDTLWNNAHRHTYAFPSYPSAHGTASAAAMTAVAATFGDEHAFTMSIPVVDIAGPFSEKMFTHPPTRSFSSFSQAAMECALSRVYLGIHFRYDSVEGVRLGNQVGRMVVKQTLLPVRD